MKSWIPSVRGKRILLVTAWWLALAPGALPVDLLVYNHNDSGAGSLRQAIQDNNSSAGGNTIVFSNTLTGTITLTSGELFISKAVTIVGPGANVLAISGQNTYRVFTITNVSATISGLCIANGRKGMGAPQGGGGIRNSGNLVLNQCVLTNNRAQGDFGGGVFNDGSLDASDCFFVGNTNASPGGALANSSFLTLNRCAFVSNNAPSGGALYLPVGSTSSINNCTIIGNHAGNASGGGIANGGSLQLRNSTVVGNYASHFTIGGGGGISGFDGTAVLRNTIVAGNGNSSGSSPDCAGAFTSEGFNFIGNTNGSGGWGTPGDQYGTSVLPLNPMLGPLQANGGPTPTMKPLPGSPLLDQGFTEAGADQRGAPRPVDLSFTNAPGGDGSDIGAFELGSPTLNIQPFTSNTVISWPYYYGDFTLQSVTDVIASNSWANVAGTPVVVANQYVLTNGPISSNRFYRLKGN